MQLVVALELILKSLANVMEVAVPDSVTVTAAAVVVSCICDILIVNPVTVTVGLPLLLSNTTISLLPGLNAEPVPPELVAKDAEVPQVPFPPTQ